MNKISFTKYEPFNNLLLLKFNYYLHKKENINIF